MACYGTFRYFHQLQALLTRLRFVLLLTDTAHPGRKRWQYGRSWSHQSIEIAEVPWVYFQPVVIQPRLRSKMSWFVQRSRWISWSSEVCKDKSSRQDCASLQSTSKWPYYLLAGLHDPPKTFLRHSPRLISFYSRRFATATARTASLGSHSRGMIQGREWTVHTVNDVSHCSLLLPLFSSIAVAPRQEPLCGRHGLNDVVLTPSRPLVTANDVGHWDQKHPKVLIVGKKNAKNLIAMYSGPTQFKK